MKVYKHSLGVDRQFDKVVCVSPQYVVDLIQESGRAGRAGNAAVLWLEVAGSTTRTNSANYLTSTAHQRSVDSLFTQQSCWWKILMSAGSDGEIKNVLSCASRHDNVANYCSNCATASNEVSLLTTDVDNEVCKVTTEKYNRVMSADAERVVREHCRVVAAIIENLNGIYVNNQNDCVVHLLQHKESHCPDVVGRCFKCGSLQHRYNSCSMSNMNLTLRVQIHDKVCFL